MVPDDTILELASRQPEWFKNILYYGYFLYFLIGIGYLINNFYKMFFFS